MYSKPHQMGGYKKVVQILLDNNADVNAEVQKEAIIARHSEPH